MNRSVKRCCKKDIKVHYEVIKKILDFARSIDLHVAGLSFSPIKGPEGNIEYLAYLKKPNVRITSQMKKIQEIVDKSHNLLLRKEWNRNACRKYSFNRQTSITRSYAK